MKNTLLKFCVTVFGVLSAVHYADAVERSTRFSVNINISGGELFGVGSLFAHAVCGEDRHIVTDSAADVIPTLIEVDVGCIGPAADASLFGLADGVSFHVRTITLLSATDPNFFQIPSGTASISGSIEVVDPEDFSIEVETQFESSLAFRGMESSSLLGKEEVFNPVYTVSNITIGKDSLLFLSTLFGNGHRNFAGLDLKPSSPGSDVLENTTVLEPEAIGSLPISAASMSLEDESGDLDGDGRIGSSDIAALSSEIGNPIKPENELYDFDRSGDISQSDVDILVELVGLGLGSGDAGDIDVDGDVDCDDLSALNAAFGAVAGDSAYVVRADMDLDSDIDQDDRDTLLNQLGAACSTGDLDGDGCVGSTDLAILNAAWGPCPPDDPCLADFNQDGTVGAFDLATLINAWGGCE